MKSQSTAKRFDIVRMSAALFTVLVMWLLAGFAAYAATVPLTIKVIQVSPTGVQTDITNSADFRWTVEEDATKASVPGKPADQSNYSFSFHTSYMPVVAAGRRFGGGLATPPTTDPDVLRLYSQQFPALDDAKRYFVSVAAVDHQMGAAPVVFGAGGATATVYVNQYPLPTAQISVFVFNDNNPINGKPDLPRELGLAGFTVKLAEAGGTYGASGGEVTQDAFANPLGTTYNADGTVKVRGNGIILTNADGVALISNLFPAKYTVYVVPPNGSDWHQTSTIEGTKGIDAWVKNNEPSFFQEFGPPGHHAFIGFTRSGNLAGNKAGQPCDLFAIPNDPLCTPVLNGPNKVSGTVVNTHNSRPPVFTFYTQAPVTECWVSLNEPLGGRALYATPCKKDSTFEIPKVPPGTYEVTIWDEPLDMIIASTTITVGATDLALGNLSVSSWFGRYQGRVFQDLDGTGLPYFNAPFDRPYVHVDPITGVETERQQSFATGDLKPPLGAGVANNIRFRDGSIYQMATTKDDGTFAFTEVFPFFNWMVAEIDYARFKATSATVVVDGGGLVDPVANQAKLWKAKPGLFGSNDPALAYDPWIRLNPQQQADADCVANGLTPPCYFRTESVGSGAGAILLEGMQTFLSQTNHIEWGKVPYKIDENGGIAGIVYYGITRAEDDPRFATAENWEPGIPRVQVNVYLDCDADGKPDKPKNDGSGQCESLSSQGYVYVQPDVDNYPFCWRDPASCGLAAPQKGLEDFARGGDGTNFSYGDVFRWGAPGTYADRTAAELAQLHIGLGKTDSWDDSIPTGCPDPTPYSIPNGGPRLDCFDGLRNFNQLRPSVFDGGFAFGRVAGQAELPMIIGAAANGRYILEAVAPPGYLHQGNGDKNVVFGDTLQANPAALPHECVGMELDVPASLTLFPGEPNPNFGNPQYPGNKWRKCDMKAVPLSPGQNAAPNFFLYTEAPVAGHGVGFILDDTATEFNQFAPNFGEKYAPPHMPVSVRDWSNREISRVYSDEFGSYNFLVPSTFTINPPYPSGVGPSMMVSCMNHPGPIVDTRVTLADGVTPNPTFGQEIIDPYFNRAYSQFCYTLQYLPGKTTYLDTPVVPVAAFAPVTKNPLDCECADHTPEIYSANNANSATPDLGPWVPAGGGQLTIVSVGPVNVTNPAYDPADPTSPRTVQRDYGFGGTPGRVTLNGTALAINTWDPTGGLITVTVPATATTGQLIITRGDNLKESVVGLTVHVGGNQPKTVNLAGSNGAFKTIQEAIDSPTTVAGDLITIAPGTYREYVVLDKRVRLQGWGAGSTAIDAGKSATGALAAWRALITAKRLAGTFDLLTGQEAGFNAPNNEPLLFGAEEGPGVLVVGKASASATGCLGGEALRIDGLTVTGSDAGGGILASGYACGVEISNNRVVSNYGTYGGGVRVGHTVMFNPGTTTFTDAVNRNASIHHNWISQNGATAAGGGGGITLGKGSDGYLVASNYVCGNFSMSDGGGLSHVGLSAGSIGNNTSPANTIARNKFIFNQNFNQSADPAGAGISIASQIPLPLGTAEGTGDVVVDGNLIQGNQAGAGAGGGVSIARTLVADDIHLINNMIVNNVAAYAGGGVALFNTKTGGQNSENRGVKLINNTVASNASTATNRQSFGPTGAAAPSLPQIAGVAVIAGDSPTLLNNVIWANRSFVFMVNGLLTGLYDPAPVGSPTPVVDPGLNPAYNDLGRIAGAGALAPRYSVLTDTAANQAAYLPAAATCSNTAPTPAAPGAVGLCNRYESPTSTALFVKPEQFGSIVDPGQPLVLQDQTVYLRSALTFDETGNFVNVLFQPLTLFVTTPGPTFGELRADYHIKPGSIAQNNGRARDLGTPVVFNEAVGTNFVPLSDIDGDGRIAVDIGADEIPVVADLSITKTNTVTTVVQGGAVSYTVTVTNNGPDAVTGAVVADIRPAAIASWSWTCVGTACGGVTSGIGNINRTLTTLAAGQSVTYTVSGTVSPTAVGSLANTATVTAPFGVVDRNTLNNSATHTDTILSPAGTLSPTSLAFANIQVGETSLAQTITLTSTGGVPLQIVGVGLTGANANHYAQTNDCPASLVLSATCTITVSFKPTTAGAKNGVTVAVNSATGAIITPASVALTGTGVVPANTALPTPLAFGSVQMGQSSTVQTVTVTNTGVGPLTLSTPGITITGAGTNASEYALRGGTCASGGTVAVGGLCTIDVQFSPTAANLVGNKPATLNVLSNATTKTVSLTGTATAPADSVAPATLAFGSVQIGQTGGTLAVTVTNTGFGPLTMSAPTITGANPGEYQLTDGTCLTTPLVPVAGTCTITVTFKPVQALNGAKPATLNVLSDATAKTVNLTGTSTVPANTALPSPLAFASVQMGQTKPLTVTVTNTGLGPLALAATPFTFTSGTPTVPNTNASLYQLTGGTCTAGLVLPVPGNSCTVIVSFSPTVAHGAGNKPATLNVFSDATAKAVSLTGTATAPANTALPTPLAFGTVARGSSSAAQTVTVANTGFGPLTLGTTAFQLAGANPASYSAVGTGVTPCASNLVLPVGGTCTIAVTFSPLVAPATMGLKNATLQVLSDATQKNVALSGTAN